MDRFGDLGLSSLQLLIFLLVVRNNLGLLFNLLVSCFDQNQQLSILALFLPYLIIKLFKLTLVNSPEFFEFGLNLLFSLLGSFEVLLQYLYLLFMGCL